MKTTAIYREINAKTYLLLILTCRSGANIYKNIFVRKYATRFHFRFVIRTKNEANKT